MGCFNQWICIALCFISFSAVDARNSTLTRPTYKLCVCGFFQDEAPYLKEWIEYHLLLGVEHFFLFNNDSTDNFRQVLKPYIKAGLVELKDWPSEEKGGSWLGDQTAAYNSCIKKCVGLTSWLAIIDIDEFIIPVDKPNLIEFLSEFDHTPLIGAIKINWQLYGTSFLPALPKDKLLVESLTWKAVDDYDWQLPNNTVVKSIVRPEAVKQYWIHSGIYHQPYYTFPEGGVIDKKEGKFQPVNIERIRINHYWTRAEDFFYEVKINRRSQFIKDENFLELMMQKLEDLNQVEDRIISKWVPELRKRMGMVQN